MVSGVELDVSAVEACASSVGVLASDEETVELPVFFTVQALSDRNADAAVTAAKNLLICII